MADFINTIIVGGGQGGLSTSYYLKKHGLPHIILDKTNEIAHVWRNRWDSFTLITPNWMVRLPGAEYKGKHPDSFMAREEVVTYFKSYVDKFELPIKLNTCVKSIEPLTAGYVIRTNSAEYHATNVVVATGLYQQPKFPPCSSKLSSKITKLHSSEYKIPQTLPDGAVLVVGSSQSGAQIAEELYQCGRKVYLSVSNAGRIPRRYRGRDFTHWMNDMGDFARTVDELSDPRDKFAPSSHGTGKNGGHTINLHQFARDGVTLLGRIQDGEGEHIILAPDLKVNLAKADKFEDNFIKTIDTFIAQNNINAPIEVLPNLTDGYEQEEVLEMNLISAGISSIIWSTGYKFDFSMVKVPTFDEDGYPIQHRGVTAFPGLYFIGLPFLYSGLSGVIAGVGVDAAYIASTIISNGNNRFSQVNKHRMVV